MNEGLTKHEWALLHRAMDRVGQCESTLPSPSAEKIRASALAAYRHQDIPVSEEVVAQAVEEELSRWRARAALKPSLNLPALPSRLLWRWSQSWKVVPADEDLMGQRPSRVKGRAVQRWEQALAPYVQHVPQSDEELGTRLTDAARFQLARWKQGLWTAWGMAGVGVAGGTGLGLLNAWLPAGLFLGINGYLAMRCWLKTVDAQAKLALIGQALADVYAQRWESDDLQHALRGTGMVVVGSLRPLPVTDPRWERLRQEVRGLPGLTLRAMGWMKSGHLRENDRVVLEKTAALMREHPTRQLMQKLVTKARQAVAPLFWGR